MMATDDDDESMCFFLSLLEVCSFCCDHYLFKRGILGKKRRSPGNASGGVPISEHCQCKRLQTWWSEGEIENRCKKDSLLYCFQMVPWTVCRCCSSSCSHLVSAIVYFCSWLFGRTVCSVSDGVAVLSAYLTLCLNWEKQQQHSHNRYLFFCGHQPARQTISRTSFRQFTFSPPIQIESTSTVKYKWCPYRKKLRNAADFPLRKGVQLPYWILQRKIWLSFLINSNDKT